jgi:4-amino-4-deoxy-L-arabinose transferase-like glycosyltransferase
VRLIGSVLMLGASVLLYAYSRMWFGRTAALMSAAALQVLPGVTIALRQQRAWGWYLAGFGLGAAMLSKYTGVFLAIGTVLAVVAYRPWRRHLRSAHPYLAVLLAGAMFSPVLVWNARHEWASFQFQFVGRFARESFDLRHVGTFLLYQVVAVTPLVLCVAIVVYARLFRAPRRLFRRRWVITVCFSLPLLLALGYKSLSSEIHLTGRCLCSLHCCRRWHTGWSSNCATHGPHSNANTISAGGCGPL